MKKRNFKNKQFQNCYNIYINATEKEIESMSSRAIQAGILDSKFYQGYIGEVKWSGNKDCLAYVAYIAGVDRRKVADKPKLIKYIPTHLQNSISRVEFGAELVVRFRFIDSYRYRVFNATEAQKIHFFDTNIGIYLCASNLSMNYQFIPQEKTDDFMELYLEEHYCKKCLSKCEIIEDKINENGN